MGVKTPKYTSAKIILNGQKWGLMQIEESFSNSFLEKRQLKKKPIYKISNEDDLILGWKYFENGLRGLKNYSINEDQLKILSKWLGKFEIKSLNMKSNFINSSNLSNENPINISLYKDQKLIETILYKANSEKNEYFNEIRNNFDIQSISDAIISSIIWGEQHFHSIEAHNARFYLNPFTKLIEIFPNDHAHTFILDVNKPNIINQIKNMPYLFRILFFNDNIQDNINLSIIKFKKNLSLIKSDFNNICRNNKIICKKKVKLTCKSYNLDNCRETYYLDEIINNIEFLEKNYHEIFSENNFNKNLNKKKIDLDENWVAREVTNKIYVYENENEFKIINLIPYDIIIDNIEIYNDDNSLNNIIELKKILNKSNLNKFSEINFNFKKQHKGKILYYKINYYLKNSDIRLNQTFIKNNIKINKSQSSKN